VAYSVRSRQDIQAIWTLIRFERSARDDSHRLHRRQHEYELVVARCEYDRSIVSLSRHYTYANL
jgi:hypothetical protein